MITMDRWDNMNYSEKWDKRFLRIAKEVSSWSKDPSKQIGSVATIDNRIIATGYNGFPSGIEDKPEWLEDRTIKYDLIIHAEMNLLMDATRTARSLEGSTIYVWGLIICPNCMKHLIAAGITRFVYVNLYDDPYWNTEWNTSLKILQKTNKNIETLEYKKEEILL